MCFGLPFLFIEVGLKNFGLNIFWSNEFRTKDRWPEFRTIVFRPNDPDPINLQATLLYKFSQMNISQCYKFITFHKFLGNIYSLELFDTFEIQKRSFTKFHFLKTV